MNNPRGTYMNGRPRTNNHMSTEPDRSNYHPTHGSLNKPSLSKQAHLEKMNEMASKVVIEVNRHHNNTQLKAITREMLKEGGSKVFMDVFAILTRAVD